MPAEPEDDDPGSQAERRRVLANDVSVQRQSGTFLSHTHADTAGGRFAAAEQQTIIGRDGPPRYPALPSGPWSGADPVGTEPPLGFSVDAMVPLEPTLVSPPDDPCLDAAQATGGSADASSASDVERTEPPSFSRRR